MSTINSQRNIIANYNGQTENWHHTYLQIQNARTYDRGFVGSDGAKLSVYEALPMVRNVDADEQLESDTIATLISDVRTVNADTDHRDRAARNSFIQRRYT